MTPRTATKRRLCLGSHLSVAGGVSKAIDAAIELDVESLQIFTKNASRWQQKPTEADEVGRFVERREAWGEHPIVSHDSYLINLASPDQALWKRSTDAFKDELHRAELLGLDFLVMHPGAHVGSGVDAGIKRIAKALRKIFNEVPKGSTRVLFENTAGGGSTLGRSFQELRDLADATDVSDRVGFCIDSCHLLAAGYGLRNKHGYDATMQELDDLIGAENVYCLHLNDSKGDLGSHLDRHEHIGDGKIGLSGFRRLLKDKRFFGTPKILETPKADDMDRVNLERLYSL